MDEECFLSKRDPKKPKPSLIQCYRNNAEACCVSSHDNKIADDIGSLLSPSCKREYEEIENYFCFGCHPDQPVYTNTEMKVISICNSFATRIWGEDLDKPSDKFDNCGFTEYWNDSAVVIPSSHYKDGYAFFEKFKPPFFNDYRIKISSDNMMCFDFGIQNVHFSLILILLLSILVILL